MFKTVPPRTRQLTQIACVSPRIYQTITQTLKYLLHPFYRSLRRVKRPRPALRDKSVIPTRSLRKQTRPSDNGGWIFLKTSRTPKNQNHLWDYVKTPEQYWGDLSGAEEISLQNLLRKP